MLKKTINGVQAHWLRSGKPDPEIIRLMGTHIIATTYTDITEAEIKLSRLLPDMKVEIL